MLPWPDCEGSQQFIERGSTPLHAGPQSKGLPSISTGRLLGHPSGDLFAGVQ
jgi:hypothetical protein